jgi:hypothetical protein
LRKLLAFLCLVGSAFATSPITGNLKDPATNAVSAGAFVRVFLRGASSCQPRVNGTALIPPRGSSTYYVDFAPDANGLISGTLYSTRDAAGTGDGEIQCGASKQAVWYGLQPYFNGIPGVETPVHAKNGVTLDVTNVTPITTTPTTTAPSGDTTYCRLDGGNCGFTGPITTTSSIQLSGGTSDTTAGAGKLYYRTDLNRLRYYDSAWHSLIAADTTDTMTGKTLTAPTITNPTTTGTDSGAETLQSKTLAGTTPFNRLRANQGSALVSGDWSLGGNWGTSPSLSSIMGTDSGGAVTVNSGTGSPGANPTLSLVFHDGAWATAPIVVFSAGGPVGLVWNITSRSTTGFTVTFSGTPAASTAYGFNFIAVGQP